MKKTRKAPQVSAIRLDADLRKSVSERARVEGRSLTNMVNRLIRIGLESK